MTILHIEILTQNAELCFANSGNNEIFSLEQRRQWLIKGLDLQQRLVELIGKEIPQAVDPKTKEANKKLKAINERLKNSQETLHNFNDTIQQITELVIILDMIISTVAPITAVALEVKAQERILNCIPSREIEKDWAFTNALEAKILTAQEALPPSVDLRDPSWWEIGDGCGSFRATILSRN